jgi:putative flippase GtrA
MQKKILNYQFLKFLLVGGINTLFSYFLFAAFIFLGLHYTIASFLGTISSILFNFKTTGIIVFKSHNNKLIFRFFTVYIVVYLFYLAGLSIFNYFSISNYIAGAVLILPVAFLSFVLMRKFVFNSINN